MLFVGALRAAIDEMNKVYEDFAGKCGIESQVQTPGSMEGCQTMEIRDGKLVVDLAPNSGAVAYVYNE